ncbi:MAG: hypothetical protein ACLR0N_01960 [Bilophila wadsworthia]
MRCQPSHRHRQGIPTDEQERIFEASTGLGVRDSGDQHETGVGLRACHRPNIARPSAT